MSKAVLTLPLTLCSPIQAAREVAQEIADLIRERRASGRMAVLCLPTGRTPLGVYDELVRMHRDEGLDFANVTTFNLDEFLGLAPEHPQSFRRYMRERLFAHVGLAPTQTWIPAGDVARAQVEAHCREYERAIADFGGLDYALLGIGRNGHIGFNEPGAERESRTREVRLHEVTRADAAQAFGGLQAVPERAITMGVATILEARRIRVLAFGADKREVVRRTLEAPVDPQTPSTFLRGHPDVRLFVDEAALGR